MLGKIFIFTLVVYVSRAEYSSNLFFDDTEQNEISVDELPFKIETDYDSK